MKSLKRHLLFLLPHIVLAFSSFASAAQESEDIWRNSVAMMNYLEVTAQEIDSAEANQITLDEIYSSLVSNIYPNAVDEKTQIFLTRLLDSIEAYRMIDTRRQRLDDYFQQEKAKAIEDALPDPADLLTSALFLDLDSLAEMTIGSAFDYYSSLEELDLERIEEEWDLDDEAGSVFHSLRKEAFSYMLDIVRAYDIPGEYALSEAAVSEYVQYRHLSNVQQRIQFMESSREVYEVYANYWLALADNYYAVGAYAECLDAVDQYEKSASKIFRKDHAYARILPMAVVAAQAVKQADDYETYASQRAEWIIDNTDNDEWSLRYFAAQTYLSLYLSTRWKPYLDASYNILLNNVNELVSVQIRKNSDYLKGTDPERNLLPPIYEPLVLNLNSLYLLAQELDIPQTEWDRIDGILHENGKDLFLVKPVDLLYRNRNGEETFAELQEISWENMELSVPVSYVSEDARIKAGLYQKGTWTFYTDWYLSRIQQKKGGRAAFYESQDIIDPAIPCQAGDILWIGIQPKAGSTCAPLEAAFTVKEVSNTFFQQKIICTTLPVESLPPLPGEAYQDLQADGSLLLPDQPGLPEGSGQQAAGYETSQDIASAFHRLERELAGGNTSEEILEEINRLESSVNEISPLAGAVLTSMKYSLQYEETTPETLLKLLNIAKERLPEEISSDASE